MKSMKSQSEERVSVFAASSGSEQRFRYPAREEISETDCCERPQRNDVRQLADGGDGPVRAIAS